MRDDRLAGIIPWSWMEDRLRVAREWEGYANLDEFVAVKLRNYQRDPWLDNDQDHYVEVWVEKDALSGIFTDTLGYYRVVLNVGRGYDGWTSIYRASQRFMRREGEGREVTVLYFGDFDPSGEDMHRSLQDRFAELGVYPDMPKIALTLEDARVLPGDVTKAGDTRAAAFVAQYGDLAVELDALPVEELRQRIRDSIEERINMEALEESHRIEDEGREAMDSLIEELADRFSNLDD
jgi:hypothetical protein